MADQDFLSGAIAQAQGGDTHSGPAEGAGLPPQNTPPEGQRRILAMQATGQYTPAQINEAKAEAREQMFHSGKYTPAQIDAYFGDTPPNSKPLTDLVHTNYTRNAAAGAPTNIIDAWHAGWDASSTSALWDVSHGVQFNPNIPDHMGVVNDTVAAVAQTVGDLPASIAGFFGMGGAGIGAGALVPGAGETGASEAVGGVSGALFGAGAAPQAVREVVTNIQRDHTNYTWQDIARDSAVATWNITKAGALSVVGGKVGGAVGGKALDLGASKLVAAGSGALAAGGAATTASAFLDGRMPNAHDYTVGMVTALGLGAAGHFTDGVFTPSEAGRRVTKNLQDLYKKTGIPPERAVEAARTDPILRDEIMGQDVNGEAVTPRFGRLAPPEPTPFGRKVAAIGTPEANETISHFMTVMQLLEGSNDESVSPVGAIGKNQIMPGTARQYGFDPARLHEHDYNEMVARTIAADLYQRFNGDMEAMLAAYNAGPRRGAQLQAQGPGTRLKATLTKQGVQYAEEPSDRNESFLPLETQKYLANARRRSAGGLPGRPPGPPPPPEANDRFLAEAGGEGGGGEPPKPPAKPSGGDGGEEGFVGSTDDAYDKMRTMVGEEERPPDRLLDPSKLVRQWVSELEPLRQLDHALLEKDTTLDRSRDLMLEDMGRQLYGSIGRAAVFFRYGVVDAMKLAVKKDSPSVQAAVDQVKAAGGNLSDWKMYMAAKRTMEKAEQGIKTGFDPAAALHIVTDKAEQAKYDKATKTFQGVMDGALDYGLDSGLFGEDQVARLREANPTYLRFSRIMGDLEERYGLNGRKFTPRDPLRKMEGSDRRVIDPLLATIDNVRAIVREADRNRLIGAVIMAGEKYPDLGLHLLTDETEALRSQSTDVAALGKALGPAIEDLGGTTPEETASAAESLFAHRGKAGLGDRNFVFYRNGKPEVWASDDPNLAQLLRGADTPPEADFITKTFQTVAGLVRAGIMLPIDVPMRVMLKHQLFAYITDPLHPPPLVTALRGAMHAVKLDDVWADHLASGAGVTAATEIDRNYIQRDMEKVFEDAGTWDGMWNVLRHPIEAARMVSERLDAAPRIGYRLQAIEKGVDPVKAAMMARTANIDFAEHGTGVLTNWMAKTVPFYREALLGAKNIGEGITSGRTVGIATRALVAVTLPTILGYALCRLQDQALPPDRRYDSLPRWQRDMTFPLPEVGGVRLKVPYPFQYGGVFGAMVTRFLDAFYENDRHAFDDWHQTILHDFMPAMMPSALLPPVEAAFNYNFFTGHAILPASQEKLSPQMQYTPNTTAPARAIATVLSPVPLLPDQVKSPIMVEHLVKGYTGNVGYMVMKALNVPFDRSGEPWELSDIPIVGSFFMRHPGMSAQPVQDFFTEVNEYKQKNADKAALFHRAGNVDQANLQVTANEEAEKGDFRGASQIANASEKVAKAENLASTDVAADKLEGMRAARLADREKAIYVQQALIQAINKSTKMTTGEKRQYIERIQSDMVLTAKDGLRVMHESARDAAGEL